MNNYTSEQLRGLSLNAAKVNGINAILFELSLLEIFECSKQPSPDYEAAEAKVLTAYCKKMALHLLKGAKSDRTLTEAMESELNELFLSTFNPAVTNLTRSTALPEVPCVYHLKAAEMTLSEISQIKKTFGGGNLCSIIFNLCPLPMRQAFTFSKTNAADFKMN